MVICVFSQKPILERFPLNKIDISSMEKDSFGWLLMYILDLVELKQKRFLSQCIVAESVQKFSLFAAV